MTRDSRAMPAFDADEIAALKAVGWQPDARASSCPDSSLLVAANAGVLDASTERRLREHIEACPTCQTLSGDLVQLLDADPSDAERGRICAHVRATPRSNRALWSTAGAGLLAAAAVLTFAVIPGGDVEPPPAPAITSRTAAPAAAPTVFSGGRPAVSRPEPELTVRGKATAVPLGEQIGSALDVADAGQLAQAISRLDDIVRRNGDSADAHLALGATLLRADRVTEALPVLERARTLAGSRPSEEFDWYLAAALARSQRVGRAEAILEPLCRRSTMRGALACAGLAEIRRAH